MDEAAFRAEIDKLRAELKTGQSFVAGHHHLMVVLGFIIAIIVVVFLFLSELRRPYATGAPVVLAPAVGTTTTNAPPAANKTPPPTVRATNRQGEAALAGSGIDQKTTDILAAGHSAMSEHYGHDTFASRDKEKPGAPVVLTEVPRDPAGALENAFSLRFGASQSPTPWSPMVGVSYEPWSFRLPAWARGYRLFNKGEVDVERQYDKRGALTYGPRYRFLLEIRKP